MKSITISNTKGIKSFKFVFPEKSGVYLLVGPNGIGKTTLLTCMDRICNPYAFARGFSSSRFGSEYDEYKNSEIKYSVDDTCILFRKKIAKWSASPRKGNAELLKHFEYQNSVFVKADSRRIEATTDEIKSGTRIEPNSNIVDALNTIFETQKYNNLKKLKVSRGRGRKPAFINIIKDGRSYYSEKRFSTGELAMIRLIENIQGTPDNSLILLDEAEMALHPRVQTNLLNYLIQKAKEKNLTIFVATHSPTMIKNTKPDNIIFLDDNKGVVKAITPCYPATALGGIDYEESKIYDYIFFVEDEMARYALKYMLKRYMLNHQDRHTAIYTIIPVGGYEQTATLAIKCKNQVFHKSRVLALLDEDAFETENQKLTKLKKSNPKSIFSIGFTPEVQFINSLSASSSELSKNFRKCMRCEIKAVINSKEYLSCNSTKPRKLAKDQFDVFIKKCCESTGDGEELVTDTLIKLIINSFQEEKILEVLNPIFNV